MAVDIDGVHNFSWIREGRLAGMALPREDAWPALARAGVGAVLSLSVTPPPGDPEGEGLVWRHHPIPDFGVPRLEELDRSWRWARTQMDAGRAVVVHCRAGQGRTGMILAAFLAADGIPADEAMALVRSLRPGSIETVEQEQFVRDFASRHAGRRDA